MFEMVSVKLWPVYLFIFQQFSPSSSSSENFQLYFEYFFKFLCDFQNIKSDDDSKEN